ncbi:hypothetical protein [Saccharothrix luteola]|uniref:hypothetical protein n=1 Tax=Saccharothrix luteola TaxID=2893018 RepID=UPI001E590664|nr:hypothetical protein [Saccharothrix luteola]MCC8245013.1 hypothetical protein [Saccharothrix luteola]
MAWAVTLQLTDCANSAHIKGWVSDGVTTFTTDANGQFIAIIDDYFTGYIVDTGAPGYVSRLFAIDRAQHSGTIQEVCLNKLPPKPPKPEGGTSSGW